MISENAEVVNSTIEHDAIIHQFSTIINSIIGKMSMVGKFSKVAYSSLGDLSYCGEYTIIINSTVGKYTSISWGVTIGPEEHEYKRVTNHSFLYSTKSFKLAEKKQYSPFLKECIIGNDVWIGCNTTILRGVKIGDGAVVGANCLVNSDIPPYCIAVGSPAKVIKMRFDEEIIRQMLEIRWWDLSTEVISENIELFAKEPDAEVLEKLRSLVHS